MSIGPIGAAGQSAPQIAKPELTEKPGAADHDHDADNSSSAPVANSKSSGGTPAPGTLDVKA